MRNGLVKSKDESIDPEYELIQADSVDKLAGESGLWRCDECGYLNDPEDRETNVHISSDTCANCGQKRRFPCCE